MRRTILALAVGLVLGGALLAAAAPESFTWVRDQQGATFDVEFRALSTSSACVLAPAGTTCTGGFNYTKGTLRAVTVKNVDGTIAITCDDGTATAGAGLVIAAGQRETFLHGLNGILLNCIAASGTPNIALVIEAS